MVYLIIGFAVWPRKFPNEQSFFASFFSKKEVLSYSLLCGLGMALLAAPTAAQKRSGYDDAGPQTRAMQDDDSANPGFLWVVQGEALWAAPAVAGGKSCADCHGGIAAMRGVAARYPSHDAARDRPLNLTARVNICRTEHQGAPPLAVESQAMLALTAAIGRQSRGMALHIDATGPLAPVIARGALLFSTRQGQLNLSCAQCHDDRAGGRLGGAVIPQGHANGYPQYRLEWQTLGSLARRLRACLSGVRAEPYAADAAEMLEFEAFLAVRGDGLVVETPAVRP